MFSNVEGTRDQQVTRPDQGLSLAPGDKKRGDLRTDHLKAMVTQHNSAVYSAVWPVPYACAQTYHPGSGSHGQLFRPC